MFYIWKEFKFSASHVLTGLPDDHQCARLHGHNYTVEVELASKELDETGFVTDFGNLKAIKTAIDNTYDHRHLNDVFTFNPTAENMAKAFYDAWVLGYPQLVAVRVKETDTSWAEYRVS
jgi:6-pyruvoyltetrahydropterin/6-carboxytetrahydropterin synthase